MSYLNSNSIIRLTLSCSLTDVSLMFLINFKASLMCQEILLLMAFITSQLQAHDVDDLSIWATVLLHRTRIKPSRANMTDSPMEKEYTMSLGRSTKRVWGETYSQSTHGRREDVGDFILSENKWAIGLWYGNNVITAFNLPSDKPAITSAKAKVWDFTTGAARAGAWDAAVDAVTFTPTVKPPDGLAMFVTWEY